MIIVVTAGKKIELRDADNFRAFKILNEGGLVSRFRSSHPVCNNHLMRTSET